MKKQIYYLFASALGMFAFFYFFLEELDFIITSRECVATVEDKESTNSKTYIHVSYYSIYEDKKQTGSFKVYQDIAETIAAGDHIKITYQKNFSSIYSDYKNPPSFLWLILSFFMWLLSLCATVFYGRKLNRFWGAA